MKAGLFATMLALTLGGCSLLLVPSLDELDGGLRDAGDADTGPNCTTSELICGDGLDNDCDTSTDCDDSDCSGQLLCCTPVAMQETNCDDAVDDDCDGLTDCDDSDCESELRCCEVRETFETSCDNGDDDDCDGWVDCADPDCAQELACCSAGTENEFNATDPNWDYFPGTRPPENTSTIRRFGEATPTAYLLRTCAGVAFGATLSATFTIPTGCPSTDVCDEYAALVLSPLRSMDSTGHLPAELSIRVRQDGVVTISNHTNSSGFGIALSSDDAEQPPFSPGDAITVQLEIYPGIRNEESVYLLAATVAQGGRVWIPEIETYLWLEEDFEIAARACHGLSTLPPSTEGLFFAIEGQGDAVQVSNARVTERACANPSHFQGLNVDGMQDALGMSGQTWTTGGLGAPSWSGYVLEESSDIVWDLWIDATETERLDAVISNPDFAIGGARAIERTGLMNYTALRSGNAIFSDSATHYRDPEVFARTDANLRLMGETLFVAFASAPSTRMRMGGGWPPVPIEDPAYAIFILRTSYLDPSGPTLPADLPPLIRPGEASDGTTGCNALRDPAILPRSVSPNRFWMLFTCVGDSAASLRIAPFRFDATMLEMQFTLEAAATELRWATSLGTYATDGTYGADVVTETDAEGNQTHRLWFMAQNATEATLAFAQARVGAGDVDSPIFTPYRANPVLRSNDDTLSGCGSEANCQIHGVAATLSPQDPQRYRVLLWYSSSNSALTTHWLTPTEQVRPRDG